MPQKLSSVIGLLMRCTTQRDGWERGSLPIGESGKVRVQKWILTNSCSLGYCHHKLVVLTSSYSLKDAHYHLAGSLLPLAFLAVTGLFTYAGSFYSVTIQSPFYRQSN